MTYRILFALFFTISLVACNQSNRKISDTKTTTGEYAKTVSTAEGTALATFAGGCFWCTEAAMEQLKGVTEVVSGYSGGKEENPTYRQVSLGQTSHAEAIQIAYDPEVITYQQLLDVFFVAHDPTQLNRQGPDKGTQYRSAIYYRTPEEKAMIDEAIKKLNDSGKFSDPIVTEIASFKKFWIAEEYHQDYFKRNPNDRYMLSVGKPKIDKVKKKFADWIQ